MIDSDIGIAVIAVFGTEDERGVAVHTVVACLDGKGAAGDGSVRVGMNRVITRIQRKGTACDIQSGLDACLFRAVAGGFQPLAAVGVCQRIVPYAVTLPCLDIKGSAVDVQLGIALDAVAVNVDIKGTAVDRDCSRGIGVDGSSLGCIRRVGSALDAVVGGFDNKCSLIDDDTAVAGNAVVDRGTDGRRAIVFRVAADIDRTALVKDQRSGRAALDTVLRIGDDIQIAVAAEGNRGAAFDLDRRALKCFCDRYVG